jgi:hypothetical protein
VSSVIRQITYLGAKKMSYQDELMKDWDIERQVQALEVVACEYPLIAGYS